MTTIETKPFDPKDLSNKPLAAPGLLSYRCKGLFGWTMIGAKDDIDAMAQARLSNKSAQEDGLEKWNGQAYQLVWPELRQLTLVFLGGDWSSDLVIPGYECPARTWNGWAMPYFQKESADLVAAMIPDLTYNEQKDCYQIDVDGEIQQFTSQKEDIAGMGKTVVYAIGAGSWCWESYLADYEQMGMRLSTYANIAEMHSQQSTSRAHKPDQ